MRIKLDIPLTITEAAMAMQASFYAPKALITHICTDSRECEMGDLFFALKGKSQSGEEYVYDTISKGAYAVSKKKLTGTLTVKSPEQALLSLAKYYKNKLANLKYTVAITGSVGKTTTKEFLRILTESYYKAHATKGNENNTIGVSLTILSAKRDTELLILEMGMNSFGELSALSKCATPDIAIITNIGTAHIGAFGSRENIAKAKLEIKDGMEQKELILPYGEELLMHEEGVFFSAKDQRADVYIIYNEGNVNIYDGSIRYSHPIANFGNHNFECLGAAYAACRKLKLSPKDIVGQFSKICSENIRQSLIYIDDFYILSDFYNSSYESVKAALEYLSELDGYTCKSALLGSILELGNMRQTIYDKIGKLCAKKELKNLYLYGDDTLDIKASAIKNGMDEKRIFLYPRDQTEDIASAVYNNRAAGEIVLFKASNAVRLGEVLEKLKKLHNNN